MLKGVKRSPVWDEFNRVVQGEDIVYECKMCQVRYKAGASTGTLSRHLKNTHQSELEKKKGTQPTLTELIKYVGIGPI